MWLNLRLGAAFGAPVMVFPPIDIFVSATLERVSAHKFVASYRVGLMRA